jgi:hypothetical protein
MNKMRTHFPVRTVLANYIGGFGYYMFHLAWLLTTFLVLMKTMQYIVLEGVRPARDAPLTSVVVSQSEEQNQIGWIIALAVGWLLTILLVILLVLLPYLIAYLSRRIPRALLRHASFDASRRSIYLAKLFLVSVVFVGSTLLLYTPSSTYHSNTGFFITLGASIFALLFFSIQYKLTTLWHIPERSVY